MGDLVTELRFFDHPSVYGFEDRDPTSTNPEKRLRDVVTLEHIPRSVRELMQRAADEIERLRADAKSHS